MRKRRKGAYVTTNLLNIDPVKQKQDSEDRSSGPSPDDGLIYRGTDLCWYPNTRNIKSDKTEHDRLKTIF